MLFGEVCGMTVGRWFGREVRLADSVFNSFLAFDGYVLKLSAILSTSAFLVQVADISNSLGFIQKFGGGRAYLIFYLLGKSFFFGTLTAD